MMNDDKYLTRKKERTGLEGGKRRARERESREKNLKIPLYINIFVVVLLPATTNKQNYPSESIQFKLRIEFVCVWVSVCFQILFFLTYSKKQKI